TSLVDPPIAVVIRNPRNPTSRLPGKPGNRATSSFYPNLLQAQREKPRRTASVSRLVQTTVQYWGHYQPADAGRSPRLPILVLSLGDVGSHLGDLGLALAQVADFLLDPFQLFPLLGVLGRLGVGDLFARILLTVNLRAVVDALLHRADHLQLGQLV